MKSISLRRAAVASPVVAVLAAVALSAALAARGPARRPLVTEVVPDHAARTLTIRGFDFGADGPLVTLGMVALPVIGTVDDGVVADLPDLPAGTYLLALTWADGSGATFQPTLGAVGRSGRTPGAGGRPRARRGAGVRAGAGRPRSDSSRPAGGRRPRRRPEHALRRRRPGAPDRGARQRRVRPGGPRAAHVRQPERRLRPARHALHAHRREQRRGRESGDAAGHDGVVERGGGGERPALRQWPRQRRGRGGQPAGQCAGSRNTALGTGAGRRNAGGSDNIYLGSPGEPGESGVIRIGTPGTHTKTVLVGEVEGIDASPVYQ